MFHVKRRAADPVGISGAKRARRLLWLAPLALLLGACVGTTGSTGWAPPVPLPDDPTVVLVRDGDDKLAAVDVDTGAELWRFPDRDDRFPGLFEESDFSAFYGPPALVEGAEEFVIGSEEEGVVYAVRADGSSARMLFDTEDRVIAGIVVDEGVAYIPTADKRLIAVDTAQPEVALWTYDDFGGELWGTPALADSETHGRLLLVPSMDGHVYALRTDPDVGQADRLAWRFEDTDSSIAANVLVQNGTAYVGSFDRHFYALDVDSGGARWSAVGENWFWGMPRLADGRVFAADLSGRVWAWREDTGALAWPRPYQTNDEVRARPLLVEDTLLVVAKNGIVHAIDPASGEERWVTTTPIDDDVLADPVLVAGRVLVSNDDGDLFEVLIGEQAVRPLFPPPEAQG